MKKNNYPQRFATGAKYRFWIVVLGWSLCHPGISQQPTNLDPAKSYVNIDIPKTPESAAFAKYGNTEVNEFTGTANISIPIYTLMSQYLSVPVTLNYSATGIKVNQEASWVGLGFDLIAGGRITVETRGCSDFGTSIGLMTPNTPNTMQHIFTRLGYNRENAVLTPATFTDPPWLPADSNIYNGFGISEMTQFGTGEPDIFRANFLGQSITFYFDKVSGVLKYIGERTNFVINYTQDAYHNITGWTIVNDEGITYTFNQIESTTNTLPGNAIVPFASVSAWLLTQILHPSGDYINFTYSNYGYAVPAYTMSGSVDVVAGSSTTVASDQDQNVALQSPNYLTKIESTTASIDFILGTRTDLYGTGSRRLNQVTIKDKPSNTVKRTISFNYSYFQGTASTGIHNYLNTLFYYLPSPMTTSGYLATSNTRLRLDSVHLNVSSMEPPFRFYYNNSTPDKYSYGQDHWGYYNGVLNESNGYSFSHLIPFGGLRGIESYLPPAGSNFSTTLIGANRDCVAGFIGAMMLDSIVYPTGGSSRFLYEPHSSTMVPTVPVTGGGLRIKAVKNYVSGKLAGVKTYSYGLGKYMGNIRYATNSNVLSACSGGTGSFVTGHIKYSSDGAINFNNTLIGYGQVSISEQNASGQSNGSLIKAFDITTPSSNYANGGGFDIEPPYFVPGEPATVLTWTYDKWLDPATKNFPPTPSANLEGKLTREEYLDSSGNLIKATHYYYRLADYTNSFYDVRAIQNRDGGFQGGCGGTSPNNGYGTGGLRPVNLFVSPAKSFRILQDSLVEYTYSSGNAIKRKIAYQYNSYYQPMFETVYNSDGTQTITYTQTSASLTANYTLPPQGNAVYLKALKSAHIYSLPIEQTTIHRGTTGDSTVVASRLNIYDRSLPLKVYIAETAQPVTWRSQFVPAYYTYPNYPNSPTGSWDSLKPDIRYKLYTRVDYSNHDQIRTLQSLQGNTTYVWDEDYHNMLAQCTNTDSANVAFSSFETNTKGNWTFSGASVADATSPTGGMCYLLSNGNITRSGLSGPSYTVSFWRKSGGTASLAGGTSTMVTGKTINGWTYFEYTVTGATTITISGNARIDELRLYPSTSQMVSYTYAPLIGMTSMNDPGNRIMYYFYDTIGRLKWIKDQDGNIIKTFQYHFTGLTGIQY